jgi:membrane fusion protein, type I secretion system
MITAPDRRATGNSPGPQGPALIYELRKLQDFVEGQLRSGRSRAEIAQFPAGANPKSISKARARQRPVGGPQPPRVGDTPAKRPQPVRQLSPQADRITAGLNLNPVFVDLLRSGLELLKSALRDIFANVPDLNGTGGAGFAANLTSAFERELKVGLRVLIIGVGFLVAWAMLVPLSGAVVVPGTLVAESSVKKIQHPTGGVVADIPVRNGMRVKRGDLLLRLDETQARARYKVAEQQLDQVRVRLARLTAERDDKDELQAPPELASKLANDDVKKLWTSEVSLFKSRASERRSAKDLLLGHVAQLNQQISGLDAQLKANAQQHSLISSELEGVEILYRKGLTPLNRKTSLQREASRLDGDFGQAEAAVAEAKSKISEAQLQVVRTDQDFRTQVIKDLSETQDKEAQLVEQAVAARDLLNRVEITAPTSGIVQQLAVHTIGGVITPGEVVMEIVPEKDELQIETKLPPQDIDQVQLGQPTSVRLSAFNQRTTPQLKGTVSYISADLNRDSQTNAAYYTVRVTLSSEERHRLGGLRLVLGMPAEVFLETGSRTMMSYLLKPITDQLLRTFNER